MSMINDPKRYDVYLADLNPTRGSEMRKVRPVVVISPNIMNSRLDTVVVCPLTTKLHPKWRGRIQITCSTKQAEICVDQIRTISKVRLIKHIDSLNDEHSSEVRRLITELYGEG
jgi:mRNA interferase MazF